MQQIEKQTAHGHPWGKKSPHAPPIDYLPDDGVDAAMDRELRDLLCICFTGPQDAVFKTQRYFKEPYPHRWIIRDAQGKLVAHIGVHVKTIQAGEQRFQVGGIAEVCVYPEVRGRGYVKAMLPLIHRWLAAHGFDFAMLFGATDVYRSSGYIRVENVYQLVGPQQERKGCTPMIALLGKTPWPSGEVYLPGPAF